MNSNNPRKVALNILINIEEKRAYSNLEISKVFSSNSLSYVNKRFTRQLVYGVLENKLYLDYIIDSFSKTKISKIDKEILQILRIGLYQIIFLDKIPDSAAVNEAVKLAKNSNRRLSGFVNGILRNFIRNKGKVVLPDINSSPIDYLSIKFSHPKWIVSKWINDFGIDFTEGLLKENNTSPTLTIRTNTLKLSREELIDLLVKDGVECEKGVYTNESIIIHKLNKNLEDLDSYKEGFFQVQDESSMLVGYVLSPKTNETILDVCSAPGGKATHIAQLMDNTGVIIARDIHSHKLELINDNAKRLGISIIKTQQFDALNLDKSLLNSVDRVLIDAPCSGLGIIRRKPEIRYFKCSEDLSELSKIQHNILTTNSKYVKVNGTIVYSTCTIESEENDLIIRKFLSENDNFILEDVNQYLPNSLQSNSKTIQLYPHIHKTDGFFVSRLKRIK